LVLRPRPWLQPFVRPLAPCLVGEWFPEIVSPSPAKLALGIVSFVLFGSLLGFELLRVRLVVTPHTVEFHTVDLRVVPKRRDCSLLRADVRSVHIYPGRVWLQADSRRLLWLQPWWSVRQLTALATELGVPLVTHRVIGGEQGAVKYLYQPPPGLPLLPGQAAWPR
jgi:hypothetical protein